MFSKSKLALVAVLVAMSASSALAANNKKAMPRLSAWAAVTGSVSVPGSAPSTAEKLWMDRASAPSSF